MVLPEASRIESMSDGTSRRQVAVVGGGILTVNQVRTLAAHHYENEGGTMDVEEQLLDSITLRGPTVHVTRQPG